MNSVPQSVLMHLGLPIFWTNERKESHASLLRRIRSTCTYPEKESTKTAANLYPPKDCSG